MTFWKTVLADAIALVIVSATLFTGAALLAKHKLRKYNEMMMARRQKAASPLLSPDMLMRMAKAKAKGD